MKKLFLTLGLSALVSYGAFAASQTVSIASGVMTNFPIQSGSVKITQILMSSATTNYSTSIQFVDTYTNWLVYTNAAYSNILSYATNYTLNWTNYYGAVNSWTNLTLVDLTNSVAGTTNNFPTRILTSIGTNSSLKFDNVNYYFQNGLWITNSGPGAVSFTITYQQ